MTNWLIIFGLGLAATIIVHGHRQVQRTPQLDIGNTDARGESVRKDNSRAERPATAHNTSAIYVTGDEGVLALETLQEMPPRIWRMTFHYTCWAQVLVALYDHGAKYDPDIGAYHIFQEDGGLGFSVSATGANGRLPAPTDRLAHKAPIEALLLLLPHETDSSVTPGHQHLLAFAQELTGTAGGHLILPSAA